MALCLVDYDLSRLGERQFEHLSQALAVRSLGPHVTVFGAGKDGGREATWQGAHTSAHLPGDWDGYGVIQAKFKNRLTDPAKDASWLISSIKHEFDEWVKPSSKRSPIPDFYLIVTNVVLSPEPSKGYDKVRWELQAHADKLGLDVTAVGVWAYDQIRVLLDDAADIRAAYAAWTTPGDVLSRLIEAETESAAELKESLQAYAARSLNDDLALHLTQAGSSAELRLADVFIDLPARGPQWRSDPAGNTAWQTIEEVPGIVDELVALSGGTFRLSADSSAQDPQGRVVLVGGPGQGKSTVGRYLCQVFRTAFLEGTAAARVYENREAIRSIEENLKRLDLRRPSARRWPVHVILTSFADALSAGKCTSLLQFVANSVRQRAGLEVTATGLRSWLRDYPWVVVLDGLDEVPATSNRAEVLRAIADFMTDAGSVDADVFVVATTRPQGYNDDFDPRAYAHFQLSPLSVSTAIAYSQALISLRAGEGSERAERLLARVRRAAADPQTARLLVSPLQVTIITLLVERLGHAPKDRWRLFSQYYQVIYQREQEKPGELADLLQRFEDDVHAVHYEAALRLQRRGEGSGDTESVLTKDAFGALIRERLEKQGRTSVEAADLTGRFMSLLTDRLVFLALLREDAVGFEIRSLQEFMAGEALMQLPEMRIPQAVRSLAMSSYWRNVLLFTVGHIFAARQVLRGEVVSIVNDLNIVGEGGKNLLGGSRLALEILEDGIGATAPNYGRPLASCAIGLLDLPVSATGRKLRGLADLGYETILRDAVVAKLTSSNSTDLAALLLAADLDSSLLDTNGSEHRHISASLGQLLAVASRFHSRPLLDLVALRSLTSSLDSMPVTQHVQRYGLGVEPDGSDSVSWCEQLLLMLTQPSSSDRLSFSFLPDGGQTSFILTGIGSDAPAWRSLQLALLEQAKDFALLNSLADFAEAPAADALADVLVAYPSAPRVLQSLALRRGAWPLVMLLRQADTRPLGREADTAAFDSSRLADLADKARAGTLGDTAAWRRCEERWGQGLDLEDLLTVDPTKDALAAAAEDLSFPLAIAGSRRSHGRSEHRDWIPVAARTILDSASSPRRRQVLDWLLFATIPESSQYSLAEAVGGSPSTDSTDKTHGRYLRGHLSGLELADVIEMFGYPDPTIGSAVRALSHLSPVGIAEPGMLDVLRWLGERPYVMGWAVDEGLPQALRQLASENPTDWRLWRLLFAVVPPGQRFSEGTAAARVPWPQTEAGQRVRLYVEALNCDMPLSVDWLDRGVTSRFVMGADRTPANDSFTAEQLLSDLRAAKTPEEVHRASHLSALLAPRLPVEAGDLLDALWDTVSDRPAIGITE